jgi:hypothetical protein
LRVSIRQSLKLREVDVERHLVRLVEKAGGKAYKFVSPGRAGVADRLVVLPSGRVWFVELKVKGGRLSALQQVFAADMAALGQNYTVLWSKEDATAFVSVHCG